MEVYCEHWTAYTNPAIRKVHVRISSIIRVMLNYRLSVFCFIIITNYLFLYTCVCVFVFIFRHPEAPCTYLTDNFSSRCSQIYNYHRLLSWDNKRGLHIDIFKVRFETRSYFAHLVELQFYLLRSCSTS